MNARLSQLAVWASWAAAGGILVGAITGWTVGRAFHTPLLDTLPRLRPESATRVIGADGSVIGSFAAKRRIELPPEEIPIDLKNAIVAGEDERFYSHGGVSWRGIARAVVGSVMTGRLGGAGGGSTITQQLALNLFLTRDLTLGRKIREALLAINLEKRLTKDQILTRYANLIYFGRGAYGVEAAARAYFDRPVGELDRAEQALLAAMIPSPERKFNPTTQPEAAKARRDRVLATMLELGTIDEAAYSQAVKRPLVVVPRRTGAGPASHVLEQIRQELVATYGQEAVYAGGLKVRVTVDSRLQQLAEDAVREGLVALDEGLGWRDPPRLGADEDLESYHDPSWTSDRLVPGSMVQAVVRSVSTDSARVRVADIEATIPRSSARWTRASSLESILSPGDIVLVRLPESLPQSPRESMAQGRAEAPVEGGPGVEVELLQEPAVEGALVVLDTHTGAVLALVGGFDFARSEFNRATQAVRQCGSAFKPVVYLTAFEHGMTPADTLLDAPFLLPGAGGALTYCPKNFYPAYYGITTLRRAVELSYNATAVKLQELVGPQRVIDTARRLGISSALEPYPSMALGAFGVRLIELTRAYAAIGGLGELPDVHVVNEARDRDGRLLEQVIPRSKRVVSAPMAYLMLNVLRGVVDRGTARSLASVELDLAGKTGTTDDYTDAWFVGMTPSVTIGVWVGRDDNTPIGRHMSGSRAALPIWRRFIEGYAESVTDEVRAATFPVPAGVVLTKVDADTGLLPCDASREVVREAFLAGTEPTAVTTPADLDLTELPWPFQLPAYTPHPGEPMPTKQALKVADRRMRVEFGVTSPPG